MPYSQRLNKQKIRLLAFVIFLSGCGAAVPTKDVSSTPESSSAEVVAPTLEELASKDFKAGVLAMESGNHQLAVDTFTAMTTDYPNYAGPYANLGILKHRKGKDDEAEVAFLKAVELSSNSPETYNQLAVFYRDLGRFHQARDTYENGLKIYPDYPKLHRNLGILFDLYFAQPTNAVKHYQKYQELVPGDAQVKIWIADLLQRIARQN